MVVIVVVVVEVVVVVVVVFKLTLQTTNMASSVDVVV